MTNEQELLYRAIGTPLGIVARLGEPSQFRLAVQRLYEARRKSNDPVLATLQFRSGPDSSQIWIVKGGAKRQEVLDGTPA